MGLFKKKNKINIETKFKLKEFVSFHMNNDLKYGVIKKIKLLNDKIFYDINVGGEASWIAYDIEEDKIIKINK